MKIFLGVAGVLALIGTCFACLSIYAKKEINKPRFEMPEIIEEQPVSALPATKEEAFDYVSSLYVKTVTADDVEESLHTDVHLTEGEKTTPLSDTDSELFSRVLEKAQGEISALYPSNENTLVTQSKDIPPLGFTKADVTDFTATKGYVDENEETVDDGNYYITLTVKPEKIDKKAMLDGEVLKNVEKELAPVLTVASLDIVPEGFTASFKIAYYNDLLVHTEFKRNTVIKAAVSFTDAYKALGEGENEQFELPYETVQSIDFFNYGIHFTSRQLALQKSDMQALPLEVRVNSNATKEDYKLTFDVSKDGLLEIDKDGVMTVKGAQEEPVTVTATLEYDGHTYSDSLIVYATEMEVKTDEPAGN